MFDLREEGVNSKAWPFEEARRVLKRYENSYPDKGYVLFQTGYGPSGLPLMLQKRSKRVCKRFCT